VSYINSPDCNC